MLSYDYCHFEFSKSTDEDVSNEYLDNMRKECMRLADKAILQYRIAKKQQFVRSAREEELRSMKFEVECVLRKLENDRTIGEIAKVKAFNDRNWEAYISERYDYEDTWDESDFVVNK